MGKISFKIFQRQRAKARGRLWYDVADEVVGTGYPYDYAMLRDVFEGMVRVHMIPATVIDELRALLNDPGDTPPHEIADILKDLGWVHLYVADF